MVPLIKEILAAPPDRREVLVRGWVRTRRDMKNLVFVEIHDGSCFNGLQCACDGIPVPPGLTTGASVEIRGTLVPSPAQGQAVEIAAASITLIGEAPGEEKNGIPPYPLQKKRHTLEFLRETPHLRGRTNTIGAVTRVRGRLAFAVHRFFQDRGYHYLHTPVITGSDAEGAGAMFRVTTLDPAAPARPQGPAAKPDYREDFFGRESFLTVSGQLEAEAYAMALSRVYTFGPTFRAENSNTARHLAEFWMIEPETAFFHLADNMDLAEDFLKYCLKTILEECPGDLDFFDQRYQKGLTGGLRAAAEAAFTRLTYTEAMGELEKAAAARPGRFEFAPAWGRDLQSEHETFLTEELVRGPVIVTDYPKEIKAFYMKLNGDGKTVRAMDVLVPRLGEIIGGSEREENLAALEHRMAELGMDPDRYGWYLDLRRYGTAPHAGFGLGFERLVQYVTGMANIRDVIPYPRAAGRLY
ncbi:MAG: asparagine--tRNA ligase [Treponema sp.]|jgi:asparaginyl-tRNA synthetase|nr:asparagine--tRNA ligase [Treponema sp.]